MLGREIMPKFGMALLGHNATFRSTCLSPRALYPELLIPVVDDFGPLAGIAPQIRPSARA